MGHGNSFELGLVGGSDLSMERRTREAQIDKL